MRKPFLQSLSVLFFMGCSLSGEEVIKYNWKYSDGYYIGDLITFDGQHYRLEEENEIYKEGIHIATIKQVNKHDMTISAVDTTYNGRYILK